MAHLRGVFGDVYRLAPVGGRKHWPSRYRGNLQVKRVSAAKRKTILQGYHAVYQIRVEGEQWGPLHPGIVRRQNGRTRRGRELDLHMALAERLAVQQGRERQACQVGMRTEVIQGGLAGDLDS